MTSASDLLGEMTSLTGELAKSAPLYINNYSSLDTSNTAAASGANTAAVEPVTDTSQVKYTRRH